jgi:hypothetical protein
MNGFFKNLCTVKRVKKDNQLKKAESLGVEFSMTIK